MPRTTYRFRVAPILITEAEAPSGFGDQTPLQEPTIEQGEWSDISNIATKDNQTFEIGHLHCATQVAKGRKKWLAFDKAGTMLTQYGYSFGEHIWQLKVSYQQNSSSINNNPL